MEEGLLHHEGRVETSQKDRVEMSASMQETLGAAELNRPAFRSVRDFQHAQSSF
jgi:hypothetical protein